MDLNPDIYKALIAKLESEEGYRQFPYNDSLGIETIGYGRNLRNVGISKDEALYLLTNDIQQAINDLETHYIDYKNIDDVRKLVLIDMCLNMGICGLLQFSGMLKALSIGKYEDASKEMLNSSWSKEVGMRAQKLAYIMETGKL